MPAPTAHARTNKSGHLFAHANAHASCVENALCTFAENTSSIAPGSLRTPRSTQRGDGLWLSLQCVFVHTVNTTVALRRNRERARPSFNQAKEGLIVVRALAGSTLESRTRAYSEDHCMLSCSALWFTQIRIFMLMRSFVCRQCCCLLCVTRG